MGFSEIGRSKKSKVGQWVNQNFPSSNGHLDSFGGYTRYTVYTPGFRPRREDSGSKKVSIFWHLNRRPNVNHVEMESTPAWKYG
jgi:hypothetical protein